MAAGTITLTNGSDAVTGTGTAFTTDLVAGDFVVATVGGITYTLPVKSVDSDTQLTLISKYPGPTQANSAWSAIPRATQNQVTAELVAQVTQALRAQNYDKSNWQAVFSASGDITVMLPDGSTFTGPSWNKIATLLADIDPVSLQALADQIHTDAQQVAADKLNVATNAAQVHADAQATALAASSAEQSKTGAQHAKEEAAQSAQEAEASKTAIGDVQAAIDALESAVGLPIGFVHYWADRASIPTGRIALDGQILPYATYPSVKTAMDNGAVPVTTNATWLANPAMRHCFAQVDASNFRMPDYNGAVSGSIAQITLTGGTLTQQGMKNGEVPNIKGSLGAAGAASWQNGTGALTLSGNTAGNPSAVSGAQPIGLGLDASKSSVTSAALVYKDTATDVLAARAVGVMVCVVFGSVNNSGAVDGATLATRVEQVNTDLSARIGVSAIRGLDISVVSNVSIGAGACAMPNGSTINVPATITAALPTLTANTWYHIYLYLSGGSPAIEISTTAPVAYAYPAHQKTGDATRRYIGSMHTNASSALFSQTCQNGQCVYQGDWAAQRILAGGVSTAFVAMSVGGGAPITAFDVKLAVYNATTSGLAVVFSRSEDSAVTSPTRPGQTNWIDVPLQAYPSVWYKFTTAIGSGGLYVDFGGYKYAR